MELGYQTKPCDERPGPSFSPVFQGNRLGVGNIQQGLTKQTWTEIENDDTEQLRLKHQPDLNQFQRVIENN